MNSKLQAFRLELRKGRYAPKTWAFWRTTLVCFALCTMLGHWLEVPYCNAMDYLFGIVEDNYGTMVDPWYYPYWVYGFGCLAMTLALEPFKERIIKRSKTLTDALLKMYVITVILAMILETGFGLIINQPDPITGEYPFWDNSQLPLNVLGQGWLVNDVLIGALAMVYLFFIFPLVFMGFERLGEKRAQLAFGVCMVAYALCILATMLS